MAETTPDNATSPIVISGFHRSGTSLFAAYLASAGIALGTALKRGERLASGSWSGHHEDLDINALHVAALRRRGLGIFPVDHGQLPVRFTAAEASAANALIAERQRAGTWGWKDPRTCLFLDSWAELLGGNVAYLFVVRDPCAAVDSLLRRARDTEISQDPSRGLRSWLVYHREILRFVSRRPGDCRVVSLEAFLAEPRAVPSWIERRFGVELATAPLGDVFDENALRLRDTRGAVEIARRYPSLAARTRELHDRLVGSDRHESTRAAS